MVDALAQHASMGIVVDDIAWSPGMHRAWQTLQQRQEWPVVFVEGRGFLMKAPGASASCARLKGGRAVWTRLLAKFLLPQPSLQIN